MRMLWVGIDNAVGYLGRFSGTRVKSSNVIAILAVLEEAFIFLLVYNAVSGLKEIHHIMQTNAVPDELLLLREQIDKLDDELLELLVQRFAVTTQVGKLKAREKLDSVDPDRERQKLERLRSTAESRGLNGELVDELFQTIFSEVVKNHRSYLD